MSKTLRILAILGVLLGLGLRVGEVHSHDGTLHPDSCALCRVLQTPLAAPPAGFEAPRILTTEPRDPNSAAESLLGEPPVLDGRLLRAPPGI
jgi:hypothetical protein